MDNTAQYVTEKQVSKITEIALPTLRNYRHNGKGPPYVKVGRSVRYLLADVIRFMEQGRIQPGT
jgi:predicted DNA-binding transcriptional regulator AlpA